MSTITKNILDEQFCENNRIVAFDTPHGKTFQAHMERITLALLPDYPFDTHPIQFVLSDNKKINAGVYTESAPIVMLFTPPVLKVFKNESELAYILGHELKHLMLRINLGAGANSKGEEFLADVGQLGWMERAGYDSRSALAFLTRERNKLGTAKPDWFDYKDKHGIQKNRESMVRNAIAALHKHLGGLSHTPQPIPNDLQEVFNSAKHDSYVSRIARDTNLTKQSALEQLRILTDIIGKIPDGYMARAFDTYVILRDLRLDPRQSEHVVAMDHAINTVLDHPNYFGYFYPVLSEKRHPNEVKPGKNIYPAAGRLRTLSNAAQNIINNRNNPQAASIAAVQFIAEATSDSFFAMDDRRKSEIIWPTFNLPTADKLLKALESDEFVPPWHKLSAFAKNSKDVPLAQALILMGIPDMGLFEICPRDFLEKLANQDIRPIMYPAGEIAIDINPSTGLISGKLTKQKNQAKIAESALNNTTSIDPDKNVRRVPPLASFVEISHQEFLRDYDKIFDMYFENFVYEIPDGNFSINPIYFESSRAMIQKMTQILEDNSEPNRAFVRNFFLGNSGSRTINQFLEVRGKSRYEMLSLGNSEDSLDQPRTAVDRYEEIVGNQNNPYVAFVANNAHGLFTKQEQGSILAKLGANPTSPQWWQNVIGYEPPTNIAELTSVLDKYRTFWDGYQEISMHAGTPYRPYIELIQKLLYKDPIVGQVSIASLIPQHIKVLHQAASGAYNEDQFSLITNFDEEDSDDADSARREATQNLETLREYIAHEKNWPDNLHDKINIYKALEEYSLFPSEKWRSDFVKDIQTGIRHVRDPKEQVALAETLLLNYRLRDIDLLEWSVDLWTSANLQIFGKDQGTPAYHAQHDPAFNDLIARVVKHTNMRNRHQMFSKLADVLETQKEWSYLLRDNILIQSRENLEQSHNIGIAVEYSLDYLTKNREIRFSTLEFLLNPYKKSSGEKFARSYLEVVAKATGRTLQKLTPKDEIDAKRFHDNFYNVPAAARVVFLDNLLLSHEERESDSGFGYGTYYQKGFDFVASKLFPPGMKYGEEARVFLECYSNIIPDYQKSLLLASMMAAGERSGNRNAQFGAGKRLVLVLEGMGPAERKVGQKAHSHPDTPEDLRQDMGRMKYGAAPLERWDNIERIESVMPDAARKDVVRIGPTKGSASYFVTTSLEKADGTKSVVATLRANALPQAKEGFNNLRLLITELHQRGQAIAHIADTLVEMIEQAEKMSDIETNSDLGYQQVQIAQPLYNGLQIQVKGHTFQFQTAAWVSYGAEFREQQEMPGVHFNDLPEKTDKQKAYKNAAAMAHIAPEILHILSGKMFDHDRHGAQSRTNTKTNDINLFDHGAMALTPPTEDDKRLLGKALTHALGAYLEGQPISQVLFNEIQAIRNEMGKIPDYLVSVQESMLALTDFFRYITPTDMKAILAGVFEYGQIDPVIQSAVVTAVTSGNLKLGTLLDNFDEINPINIKRIPTKDVAPAVRYDTKVAVHYPEIYGDRRVIKENPDHMISGTQSSTSQKTILGRTWSLTTAQMTPTFAPVGRSAWNNAQTTFGSRIISNNNLLTGALCHAFGRTDHPQLHKPHLRNLLGSPYATGTEISYNNVLRFG